MSVRWRWICLVFSLALGTFVRIELHCSYTNSALMLIQCIGFPGLSLTRALAI
jgi:hypothetical protein